MSSPPNMSTAAHNDPLPTDEEIEKELCMLDLEDADSLLKHVQDLVALNFDDFPDDQVDDEAARYAARMTKASITDGTRTGHLRIIRHYITFHLRRNKNWDAKRVDEETPRDITAFISQKCGPVAEGFEGRKYSTAVSTRAALTMWYRNLRPNESLTEWCLDSATNTWHGLPTRSRHVSQFMVGLEKTKAKSGEVSSLLYPCAKAPINVHHTPAQLAQLRFTPEFGDYRNSGDRRNTGDYRNIGD
ncbi:hypothetical protein B0H16DRAFT_1720159 [Mycena metata]|uniref:Uncharacterized protein n=1 Tax=Mycena metata TaxID=1033252 RepID=A0AAD7NGG4_9AGAR|nr:hypothetical protein B0H16DRAFT_1720159 [Mycena metata]